jgi:predicted Ser/Thr protein kinase
MSSLPASDSSAPSSFSQLQRLDQACDRFEDTWRRAASSGERPHIEEHLSDVPEAERARLLRELIRLDVSYRRRAGEQPQREDYQGRFPGLSAAWLHSILQVPGAGQGEQTPSPALESTGPYSPAPARQADSGEAQQLLDAVLGDYDLLDLIGRGGMGVVYRAVQRRANRIVALKVVRPDQLVGLAAEQREEWIARFTREAQAAARLEGEHLVTVYEVGEAEGHHFYSMRYIPGTNLGDLLHDGPLDIRRAANCMAKVARAVAAAHRQGVVHRDLKPRNILIDGNDEPWVTDFGLAKCAGTPDLTLTGAWLGSPPYMAPEQIKDAAHVGPAGDIYSLGATLYHMLTGRPPFLAATIHDTFRQVLSEEPIPPRRLNSTIPRDLEVITRKCLHKDPSWRYASAGELADDLERFLNDEPIRARPIGLVSRARRFCRRHRRETIFAGALLLLLPLAAWAAYAFKPPVTQEVIRHEKTYVPVGGGGGGGSGNSSSGTGNPALSNDPAALSDYYRARSELKELYERRDRNMRMDVLDRQKMHDLERKYPDLKRDHSDIPYTPPRPYQPPQPTTPAPFDPKSLLPQVPQPPGPVIPGPKR